MPLFFLMALLITQDKYLVPLSNRQHCKSVLRGTGQTISLLVYTKLYMPFYLPKFHTDLA